MSEAAGPARRYVRLVGDGKQCASKALPQYLAVLQSKTSPPVDRAQALAFVVHFVGDIHQPLHAVDNNDKGGNDVAAVEDPKTPGGKPYKTELHAIWDGDLVRQAVGGESAGITTISALANANADQWSNLDVNAWAVESHAIAVRAYDAVQPAVQCGGPRKTPHEIGQAYFDQFTPDVRNQLAKASLRLTAVLKQALD